MGLHQEGEGDQDVADEGEGGARGGAEDIEGVLHYGAAGVLLGLEVHPAHVMLGFDLGSRLEIETGSSTGDQRRARAVGSNGGERWGDQWDPAMGASNGGQQWGPAIYMYSTRDACTVHHTHPRTQCDRCICHTQSFAAVHMCKLRSRHAWFNKTCMSA